MLHSIKQLYGDRLTESEGNRFGHARDFIFDVKSWAVRYLIADTGNWLPDRQVLLAPHAIGNAYQGGSSLVVHLSRTLIENCPILALNTPVSRAYEEAYFGYHGWRPYWQGKNLWGAGDFPSAEPDLKPLVPGIEPPFQQTFAPLISTQALNGYRLLTDGKNLGFVADLAMDDKTWSIREIVFKTVDTLSTREIRVPTEQISRISHGDSTIHVGLPETEMAVGIF